MRSLCRSVESAFSSFFGQCPILVGLQANSAVFSLEWIGQASKAFNSNSLNAVTSFRMGQGGTAFPRHNYHFPSLVLTQKPERTFIKTQILSTGSAIALYGWCRLVLPKQWYRLFYTNWRAKAPYEAGGYQIEVLGGPKRPNDGDSIVGIG